MYECVCNMSFGCVAVQLWSTETVDKLGILSLEDLFGCYLHGVCLFLHFLSLSVRGTLRQLERSGPPSRDIMRALLMSKLLCETHRREYKNHVQLPRESIDSMFSRFQSIVNKMQAKKIVASL